MPSAYPREASSLPIVHLGSLFVDALMAQCRVMSSVSSYYLEGSYGKGGHLNSKYFQYERHYRQRLLRQAQGSSNLNRSILRFNVFDKRNDSCTREFSILDSSCGFSRLASNAAIFRTNCTGTSLACFHAARIIPFRGNTVVLNAQNANGPFKVRLLICSEQLTAMFELVRRCGGPNHRGWWYE